MRGMGIHSLIAKFFFFFKYIEKKKNKLRNIEGREGIFSNTWRKRIR